MQLQVIPFRARHIPEIRPDVDESMKRLAAIAEDRGWAWTACLLGTPVGAAGVAIEPAPKGERPERGEAWALFSPVVKTMPISLYKAVSKGLAEVKAETRVKYIAAIVEPGDAAAGRFMRHLGFNLAKHLYDWRSADES